MSEIHEWPEKLKKAGRIKIRIEYWIFSQITLLTLRGLIRDWKERTQKRVEEGIKDQKEIELNTDVFSEASNRFTVQ